MNKTRFRTDIFSNVRQERNDVVLHFMLDLENASGVEVPLFPDYFYCFQWDNPEFSLRFARQCFYFQPNAKFVFIFPNFSHCGARISFYHYRSFFGSSNLRDMLIV